MLLAEEPHAIQYLPRSGAGCVEALLEVCVFTLELFDTLGIELCSSRNGFDRFYPGFSLQRASAETCELVAKMTHEPLELFKSGCVRTFAV
jgi:hypothetical protein